MVEATRNLTVPRGDKSVWDKPSLTAKLSTYDQERWMAVACAAALTTMGARRGGFVGGLLATAPTVQDHQHHGTALLDVGVAFAHRLDFFCAPTPPGASRVLVDVGCLLRF